MSDPAILFFIVAGVWQVAKWSYYILVYIILFLLGIFAPIKALRLLAHMMVVQIMDTQAELDRFTRLRAIYKVLKSRT